MRFPRTPGMKSSTRYSWWNFSSEKFLYSTEYDTEIQNLERRNSECALIESRRELGSQRRQVLEANRWADQAQRERIHLSSELVMKNHLQKEGCARSCQEIEELKKTLLLGRNGVTRQKLNEYSMQHDQESRTVSLLPEQIRKLQERLEIIADSKIFQDPDSFTEHCWQCPRFASSSYSIEFQKN